MKRGVGNATSLQRTRPPASLISFYLMTEVVVPLRKSNIVIQDDESAIWCGPASLETRGMPY